MAFITLFKTIDEFAEFVPIGNDMDPDFKKLPAQIDIAQDSFLAKEIGTAFLQELIAAANSETEATGNMLKAIRKAQAALANYTAFLYLPKHKVQIDSQGVRTSENTEMKDAKPFDMTQATESYLRDAYTAIEQLLEFLELNKADFETWTASKEYTAFSRAIIKSNSELELVTGITVTRRLFRFIKPHIQRIETQELTSIIGKELYIVVLDAIQSGTIPSEIESLLEIAKPAVAFSALNSALQLMDVELSDLGLTVLSNSSNNNVSRGKTAAPDLKVGNMIATCRKLGPEQMQLLQSFMFENASSYPTFPSTQSYTNGPSQNNPDSGIFSTL